MILIFDLDDTLYSEIEYVKSGFLTVSNYLGKNYKLDEQDIYQQMLEVLNDRGRGSVFNEVLTKYKINNTKNVKKCISIYRSHNPIISLYSEAEKCLLDLNSYKKYLVTDGNIYVQRNKIKALNIKQFFIKTIPTYQYGQSFSKPSTGCFEKILKWEKCTPDNLIYIGDNPNKDFVNIKKMGLKTIRVLTGGFKNVKMSSEYEAEFTLNNLNELTLSFIKSLKK
jgi:putative hydrolase of the HAD superfamily